MEETEKRLRKEIEDIRRTLKARIIPNMPADMEGSHGKDSGYGDIREFIKKEIDRFEFDWYLKKAKLKGFSECKPKELNQKNEKVDVKNAICEVCERDGKITIVEPCANFAGEISSKERLEESQKNELEFWERFNILQECIKVLEEPFTKKSDAKEHDKEKE